MNKQDLSLVGELDQKSSLEGFLKSQLDNFEPQSEEIETCAFLFYAQDQFPYNKEQEHWHQADLLIRASRVPDFERAAIL
jgi:hypothetical protein